MRWEPFKREWEWNYQYPKGGCARWLNSPKTRPLMDWAIDQLQSAQCELNRMEEYYQRRQKALEDRVQELEARFLRDSHNSSMPPSSDGLKKTNPVARTRSLRKKSGKATGGQPGHASSYLRPLGHPDRIVVTPVHRCASCRTPLSSQNPIHHEVRQVIDLKEGKPFSTEYRAEMKLCPSCGSMNHGGFPEEARAYVCYGPEVKRVAVYFMAYQLIPALRVCEIFRDLHGLKISEGSLHRFAVQASQRLKSWENKIRRTLISSPVLHFDETGIRSQGKTQWVHVTGSEKATLYVLHEKRGLEAIEEIGILAEFKGIAVHDGYSAYWRFNSSGPSHALCNAHHLRELTFIEEAENEIWATRMKECLLDAWRHWRRRKEKGRLPTQTYLRRIECRYLSILRQGYRAYGEHLPKHPHPPRSGAQQKRDSGHNLLRRLHFYQHETLAFLSHPLVPFTNNRAEQDLRMTKVKQKISGCFRSFGGAKAFFRVRSFISTHQKQGLNPFEALGRVFGQSVEVST